MSPIAPTHVVTCFLMRRPVKPSVKGDEILILRRSSRVGTYRGKWAGVSGFVEQTPDAQAFVELSEEVGLSVSDVELVRKGDSVEVIDQELDKRWIVHPYLFLAKCPNRIRLDWEHFEARWITPADLGHYETVPKLAEALARVYP